MKRFPKDILVQDWLNQEVKIVPSQPHKFFKPKTVGEIYYDFDGKRQFIVTELTENGWKSERYYGDDYSI